MHKLEQLHSLYCLIQHTSCGPHFLLLTGNPAFVTSGINISTIRTFSIVFYTIWWICCFSLITVVTLLLFFFSSITFGNKYHFYNFSNKKGQQIVSRLLNFLQEIKLYFNWVATIMELI